MAKIKLNILYGVTNYFNGRCEKEEVCVTSNGWHLHVNYWEIARDTYRHFKEDLRIDPLDIKESILLAAEKKMGKRYRSIERTLNNNFIELNAA